MLVVKRLLLRKTQLTKFIINRGPADRTAATTARRPIFAKQVTAT
jgi:hypothetical protein